MLAHRSRRIHIRGTRQVAACYIVPAKSKECTLAKGNLISSSEFPGVADVGENLFLPFSTRRSRGSDGSARPPPPNPPQFRADHPPRSRLLTKLCSSKGIPLTDPEAAGSATNCTELFPIPVSSSDEDSLAAFRLRDSRSNLLFLKKKIDHPNGWNPNPQFPHVDGLFFSLSLCGDGCLLSRSVS